MNSKKVLIIVVIIFAIILSVIFLIPKSKNILYSKKYIAENGQIWILFNEDGTCQRNISSKKCKYIKEGNTIIMNEVQDIYGNDLEVEMRFDILNQGELIHILTCYPDITSSNSLFNCDTAEKLNINYSINNEYYEDNNKTQEITTNNVTSKIDDKMLHAEDNYYYICFTKDSKERIVFSFKKNKSYKIIYAKLQMTTTSAKYENTNEISGKYYVDNNYIYLDQTKLPIVIGPNEDMKVKIFNFNGLECSVQNYNDIVENEKTEIKEEISNNNDKSDKELAQESLEKVILSLRHLESNQFTIDIQNPDNISFKLRIAKNNYSAFSDNQNIKLEYEKDGENCYQINLIDYYDNEKNIDLCINFTAKNPSYIIKEDNDGKYCHLNLLALQDNEKYNQEFTCNLNGEDYFCNNILGSVVEKGDYTLILTNKYNFSQTINFTCK